MCGEVMDTASLELSDSGVPASSSVQDEPPAARSPAPPRYLLDHYWWAYVHPRALAVFERQWLVNAILWGNYAKLRDMALDELGQVLPGRTLQIACAYGDFTPRLHKRVTHDGALDVIDALPIQLANLRAKTPNAQNVELRCMDSAQMTYADASFDRAILFFLLHEQPAETRRRTIAEALRVVKPGGRIVIVDYALPTRGHPLRYLMRPVLARLEPFALDLWREDITTWFPSPRSARIQDARRCFGGLYQIVTVTC